MWTTKHKSWFVNTSESCNLYQSVNYTEQKQKPTSISAATTGSFLQYHRTRQPVNCFISQCPTAASWLANLSEWDSIVIVVVVVFVNATFNFNLQSISFYNTRAVREGKQTKSNPQLLLEIDVIFPSLTLKLISSPLNGAASWPGCCPPCSRTIRAVVGDSWRD